MKRNLQILLFINIALFFTKGYTQNCQPRGVHITYGDYFTHNNKNNVQFQVIYYTEDQCSNSYIEVTYQQNQNTQTSTTKPSKIVKMLVNRKNETKLPRVDSNDNQDGYKNERYIYIAYHNFDFLSEIESQNIQYQIYYQEEQSQQMNKYREFNVFYRNFENKKKDKKNINFKTEKEAVKVLIFGDFDISEQSQPTYQKLLKIAESPEERSSLSSIIHLGDISYDLDRNYGQTGLDYLQKTEPIYAQIPYMLIGGNHEEYNDYYYYKHYFPRPTDSQNNYQVQEQSNEVKNENLVYSWNLGNIHFIGINLNREFDESPDFTLKFVENDLKDLDRSIYKWVIVYSHKPIYCSADAEKYSGYCQNQLQKDSVKLLEEYLHKYQVDLFISGHIHLYERSYPIYKNSIYGVQKDQFSQCKTKYPQYHDCRNKFYNVNATMYIAECVPGNRQVLHDLTYQNYPYTAFASGKVDPGYGIITVQDKNTLRYEHFDIKSDFITDYVILTKQDEQTDRMVKNVRVVLIALCTFLVLTFLVIGALTFRKYNRNQDIEHNPIIEMDGKNSIHSHELEIVD